MQAQYGHRTTKRHSGEFSVCRNRSHILLGILRNHDGDAEDNFD